MKKYSVIGIISASIYIGEYEAESEEAAEEMAEKDENANWSPSICHQCSGEVEVGDVYKVIVEEV